MDVFLCRQRGGSTEQAYILSLTPEKIVAFVPRFALEGTIAIAQVIAKLAGDVLYDDASLCLSIVRAGAGDKSLLLRLRVFQQVSVTLQVIETVSGHRQLDMQLDLSQLDTASGSLPAPPRAPLASPVTSSLPLKRERPSEIVPAEQDSTFLQFAAKEEEEEDEKAVESMHSGQVQSPKTKRTRLIPLSSGKKKRASLYKSKR